MSNQLEINKIHQGDCLERLKEAEDNFVDLVVIDPPYNIGMDSWDKIDNYLEWMEEVCLELKRVLKQNGGLYIWGSMKYIAEIKCIYSKHGFILNSWCFWNKLSKQQNSTRSYADITEHCLYFTFQDENALDNIIEEHIKPKNQFAKYLRKEIARSGVSKIEISKLFPSRTGGLTGCVSNWLNGDNIITEEQFNKIKELLGDGYLTKDYNEMVKEYQELRKKYEGLKYTFNHIEIGEKRNPRDTRIFTKNVTNPMNVWVHQNTHELNKLKHLTPKPLILIKKIIKASSNKGDIVLDCFMGSGTTAVACRELGRNFIGIEKEQKYIDIANKRLTQTTL